jgi:hypothetical protein
VVPVPCVRPGKPATSLREVEHNLLEMSRCTSLHHLCGKRLAQVGGVHLEQ